MGVSGVLLEDLMGIHEMLVAMADTLEDGDAVILEDAASRIRELFERYPGDARAAFSRVWPDAFVPSFEEPPRS
jgi:hypothetical protein